MFWNSAACCSASWRRGLRVRLSVLAGSGRSKSRWAAANRPSSWLTAPREVSTSPSRSRSPCAAGDPGRLVEQLLGAVVGEAGAFRPGLRAQREDEGLGVAGVTGLDDQPAGGGRVATGVGDDQAVGVRGAGQQVPGRLVTHAARRRPASIGPCVVVDTRRGRVYTGTYTGRSDQGGKSRHEPCHATQPFRAP